MTLADVFAELMSLADSRAFEWAVSIIASSIVSALTALFVFWFRSREPLDGAIAWKWRQDPWGQDVEKPFLVVQNRSNMPAFIKNARLLKGNFIKREAKRYAFSYEEITDGNFPLEIAAQGISSFPLSVGQADYFLDRARWFNKIIGYVFKRPYLWVELMTISGRRLVVPANDSAGFQERPLWIDLRWLHPPKPQ